MNPVIAVTGASGFIGTHLVRRLLDEGYHVRALRHRRPLAFGSEPGLSIVQGSLDHEPACAELLQGAGILIHAGARVAARNRADFHKINAGATRNLVRIAARTPELERMLLISSLAAREPRLSPYAGSKREAERALEGIERPGWDILRPPAVYGPGDAQTATLIDMLRARLAVMPAGARAQVSVLHVQDLVEAILVWIRSGHANFGTYEIGDPKQEGYSWSEVIDTLAAALNVKPLRITPPRPVLKALAYCLAGTARSLGKTPFLTPDKLGELWHSDWVVHDRRFEKDFDWSPAIDFAHGIRHTLKS